MLDFLARFAAVIGDIEANKIVFIVQNLSDKSTLNCILLQTKPQMDAIDVQLQRPERSPKFFAIECQLQPKLTGIMLGKGPAVFYIFMMLVY